MLTITGTTVADACKEITAYLQQRSNEEMSKTYSLGGKEDKDIARALSTAFHALALEVQTAAPAEPASDGKEAKHPPLPPGVEVAATAHEVAQGAGKK